MFKVVLLSHITDVINWSYRVINHVNDPLINRRTPDAIGKGYLITGGVQADGDTVNDKK